MELKAKKDGDENKERGEMVWQFPPPFARPASFLCFHFLASVQPPRAQTHLKLPQTLHKPDNPVIDILLIIILFFHKLLAPHWAPAVPAYAACELQPASPC